MDSVLELLGDCGHAPHLRPAHPADAVAGVQPRAVAEPESAETLARLLARAAAAGLAVVPRGGGTKLGWGNAPRAADLVLSTRRLDAVTEHAAGDLTVTVQAGCSIARLQEVLARQGQRLALDPAWPERATVGGILATNDGGALRLAFGSLRDQVIGITVALADTASGVEGARAANGRLARSGGRVVKNVAGYDLPKLFVGSLGTLGVITEATFRVYPLPAASRTLAFRFDDAGAAGAFVLALHDSRLRPTGVQVQAGRGVPPAVAVRLEGTSARAVEAQAGQLRALADTAGARADVPERDVPGRAASDRDAPERAVRERDASERDAPDLAAPERDAPRDAPPDVWLARERLGGGPADAPAPAGESSPGAPLAAICKLTFLPARLAQLLGAIDGAIPEWEIVAQSVGVGWLRMEAPTTETLTQSILQVRAAAVERGGSLFVAEAPGAVTRGLDVWGDPGDALPLMRRVKEHFDPRACLNPGRFVGGI